MDRWYEYETKPEEIFDDYDEICPPLMRSLKDFVFSQQQQEDLQPLSYSFHSNNTMLESEFSRCIFKPRFEDKCSSLACEAESTSELTSPSEIAIMKDPTPDMDQTRLDTRRLVTSDPSMSVLSEFERSVWEPSRRSAPVDCKDVEHKISSSDSQNVKHETSTRDSQDVKEISTHDSQNVKEQTSMSHCEDKTSTSDSKNDELKMPDFLKSIHFSNPLLLMENTMDIENSYISSNKKSNSEFFAYYEEMPVKKKETKEEKKQAETIFWKLPVDWIEPDDDITIYHINQRFECLICHENMLPAFNIYETDKTLMLDEIKNDYLKPYIDEDIKGLMHYKCKLYMHIYPSDDDYDHYRYNLSVETKLKEPMSMLYQLFMLIIILALTVFLIFLSFLVPSLPDSGIPQREMYFIILYGTLFIALAVNELFRYYKRKNDIVKTTHLTVWNAQRDPLPVKGSD